MSRKNMVGKTKSLDQKFFMMPSKWVASLTSSPKFFRARTAQPAKEVEAAVDEILESVK